MDELDATKLALAEARSELGSRIDGNKSLEQQVTAPADSIYKLHESSVALTGETATG